jgi:hypothetical protein
MSDLSDDELRWLREHHYDEEAVPEARNWFLNHGWEVQVAERDRRDEMRTRGEVYLPGFSHRFWADLVRIGSEDHVVRNYGSGANPAQAIIRAKERYGSEQA